VHGHDDGFRVGTDPLDGTGSVDTIQKGHRGVQNGDIRVKRFRQAHGRLAVRCTSDNFMTGCLQQRDQPIADQLMILSDQNA